MVVGAVLWRSTIRVAPAQTMPVSELHHLRVLIANLHADDPAYVHEAAKRGVFAYVIDGTPEELQSAIDITLQRFAEYQSLQGAFGRRALIEQAKGILMARHSINADKAFERLRDHSQHNGRKLSDVAAAIVESHLLLLPPTAHAPLALAEPLVGGLGERGAVPSGRAGRRDAASSATPESTDIGVPCVLASRP